MSKTIRNILAISIAILPINLIMIWYRLTQTENFSTTDMTVYPLLFGGGTIMLILLLNKFLLKDTFKTTFNSGKGTWSWDILIGLGLTVIYFAMFFLERATLMQWIPNLDNSPSLKRGDSPTYTGYRLSYLEFLLRCGYYCFHSTGYHRMSFG